MSNSLDRCDSELRAFLEVRADELADEMMPMQEATHRLEESLRSRGRSWLPFATAAGTIAVALVVTVVAIYGLRSIGNDGQRGFGAPSTSVDVVPQLAGIYQSAEPLRGTMCVAVNLEAGAATADLWWWGAGKTGCDSRTSDVVTTLASVDAVGTEVGVGVRISYWMDLMTGEQERVEFTIGAAPEEAPWPARTIDSSVEGAIGFVRVGEVDPTFRPVD